jgi:hypothetical protein
MARRAYRIVAAGLVAGMALVAAGITLSPSLEVVAAGVFAASLAGLAVLHMVVVAPSLSAWPRALLWLASGAVLWAMAAAVLYALGEFTGRQLVLIPDMVRLHGEVNAFGFVLPALLAWTLDGRRGVALS